VGAREGGGGERGDHVTTTEKIGRAMLNVVRHGAPKRILENADINAAAEDVSAPG